MKPKAGRSQAQLRCHKQAFIEQPNYARHGLDAASTYIAVAVGIATLYYAYLAYRDRLPSRRLQFVVTTNSLVLPTALADSLRLHHGDQIISDPALVIVRLVSTGDSSVPRDAFDSDLTIRLEGSREIAYVACTGRRPSSLDVQIEHLGNVAQIKPFLINPEDMLQLHLVVSGRPDSVAVEGRIADLKIEELRHLPYPPGTGPEGELDGPIDHFMMRILPPILALGIGGTIAIDPEGTNSTLVQIGAGVAALAFAFWLYPARIKFLIHKRAIWKPE